MYHNHDQVGYGSHRLSGDLLALTSATYETKVALYFPAYTSLEARFIAPPGLAFQSDLS